MLMYILLYYKLYSFDFSFASFQSRHCADFIFEKVGIDWLYYLHISSQDNNIYSTKGGGVIGLDSAHCPS